MAGEIKMGMMQGSVTLNTGAGLLQSTGAVVSSMGEEKSASRKRSTITANLETRR
jgi:hypothetical protein